MTVVASLATRDKVEHLGEFQFVGIIPDLKISTDHANDSVVQARLSIEGFHLVFNWAKTIELCHNLLSA